MARSMLLFIGILIAKLATADIIVQPGYGQPHSASQLHLAKHQEQVTQGSETLPGSQEPAHQHQDYRDPGYHLELHPVYGEPADARQMPLAAGHVHPGMNGYGFAGIPVIIPPQYYPYVPTVVHSRRRRSNSEELDTAAQRNKRDEDDVAKKSTLGDNLPIVDSQDQDEKRVSTRQSVSLLNLNPSNMHPVYQYRSPKPNPTFDPAENAAIQRAQAQTNAQEAIRRQVQLEELQHPMLMQQQEHEDPKATLVSAESSLAENSGDYGESQTSGVPKHAATNDYEDMVGTKWKGKYKVKVVHHLHQHGRTPEGVHPARESNTNTNPENAGYADGTSSNLAQPSGAQQVVQVYQLPNVPVTSYPQNAQYVVESRLDPANYASNYVLRNPTGPSPSFRICFENPDNAQPLVYQLA